MVPKSSESCLHSVAVGVLFRLAQSRFGKTTFADSEPDVLTYLEKSGLATSGVCRPGSVQSLSHFDVRLSGAGWAQAVVLVV
jgi:hypothetical protein